jgi:hypothetical protein
MARENDIHDSLQRDLFSLQELSRNETQAILLSDLHTTFTRGKAELL